MSVYLTGNLKNIGWFDTVRAVGGRNPAPSVGSSVHGSSHPLVCDSMSERVNKWPLKRFVTVLETRSASVAHLPFCHQRRGIRLVMRGDWRALPCE